MTQSNNRFFDDIARLMTDAAGAAQGVRREFETVVKGQIERFLKDMDLAKREEVDVLRDMVVAAREENEQLALRLKELEARLDAAAGTRAGGAGGPKLA
jgi:BMFP domain-containing protein YqiC